MAAISYSFCLSMLHSIWQSGILLLLYFVLEIILLKKITPTQKRNFLFLLTALQLIIFGFTFYNYLSGDTTMSTIDTAIFSQTLFNLQNIAPWIISAYLFILLIKFIQITISWKRNTSHFYKGLQKPLLDYKLFCNEKTFHLGIKRKVQIWMSNHVVSPVTYGFLKPVIILPIALINKLSPIQVEAIILHELSHIKANDYLLNWWLIIFENVFFFNPFARILCKKIQLEREKACDIQVIQFNYSPSIYAEALLKIQKQQLQQFQLAAVGTRKYLLERIQYFSKETVRISYSPLQAKLLRVAAAFIFIFSFAVLFFITPTNTITPKNFTISSLVDPMPENTFYVKKKSKINTIAELPLINTIKPSTKNVKSNRPKKEATNLVQKNNSKKPSSTGDFSIELTPVFFDEGSMQPKQIIIKEETSGSDKITVKSYNVIKRNGKWQLIPSMIATTNMEIDSTGKFTIDSTLMNQQ